MNKREYHRLARHLPAKPAQDIPFCSILSFFLIFIYTWFGTFYLKSNVWGHAQTASPFFHNFYPSAPNVYKTFYDIFFHNRHILIIICPKLWFIHSASGGMYKSIFYDDAMRLQRLFLRRATVCFSCESNKKASVEFECCMITYYIHA